MGRGGRDTLGVTGCNGERMTGTDGREAGGGVVGVATGNGTVG